MSKRMCKRVQVLLAIRAADRSPAEQRLVDAHVQTCTRCADLLRIYADQDRQLDQTKPQVRLTTLQRARFSLRLERERRWSNMFRIWKVALKATAGAVALVLLIAVLSRMFSGVGELASPQPAFFSSTVTPTPTLTLEPDLPTQTPTAEPSPLAGPVFARQLYLDAEIPDRVSIDTQPLQRVTLTWSVIQPVEVQWDVFLHLLDSEGNLAWQEDRAVDWPDHACSDGQFTPACTLVMTHELSLPSTVMPGLYTLRVGLYDPSTMIRAGVDGDQGTDSVFLGEIAVLPSADVPIEGRLAAGIEGFALTDPQPVIDAVAELGLGWYKQKVRWSAIEPEQGQYDWAALDALVKASDAAEIKLLFSVLDTPQWAARATTEEIEPPKDVQDYADFVAVLANRYRGRVHAYEIWHGQNMRRNWSEASLDGAAYVELLKAAYEAIESADPDALVVSGGLIPTDITDGEWAVDHRVYLQQMYDAGLQDACDAVGMTAPGYANPPDLYYRGGNLDPARAFDDHSSFFFRNAVEDVRAVMNQYGDADRRIWITEFGWGTVDGMDVRPNPGYDFTADIDEAEQAKYIGTAYTWAAEQAYIGGMFLWNLNGWPAAGTDSATAKFGIVREDWTPRPAYQEIQALFVEH